MIQDRIAKIEATLAGAPDLSPAIRQELLTLLDELKTEVATIQPSHEAQALSIAASADAAFASAANAEDDGTPAALKDLRATVEEFEASHPQLVSVVERIAVTLSNMGI